MNDFRELNEPQRSGLSKGWYVATKEGSTAWLSIHGNVSVNVFDTKVYYFESEENAKIARAIYYKKHGVENNLNLSQTVEKDLESQVMKFDGDRT